MKKLLILLIVLTVSVVLLKGNDLEAKKIMPKKLCYNELPDEYPKELEDLFRFFYDFGKQLSESVDNDDEVTKYISCYYDTLSIETAYSFCYLHWLAKNKIPLYYKEYRDIFMWKSFTSNHSMIFDEKSYLDSMFSLTKHQGYYSSPTNIIKFMLDKASDTRPELFIVNNYYDYIWVKGKVTNSEIIVNTFNNADYDFIFKNIEIEDDLHNEFAFSKIITKFVYSKGWVKSSLKPLELGKEYLLPLNIYESSYSFDFGNTSYEKGDYLFGAPMVNCFIVEDGYIINQFHSNNVLALIVFGEDINWKNSRENNEFSHGYFDKNKYKVVDRIEFKIFKKRLNDSIDFLKGNYERRGL